MLYPYRHRAALCVAGGLLLTAPHSATAAAALQPGGAMTQPGPLAPTGRDRIDVPQTPLPDATPKPTEHVESGGRPDVTIREIRFIGPGVPRSVANTAQGFVGRPASTATLKDLAAAMSKAYAKSSVALFTLAIPQQDFAGGVVKIAIAEGHISGVTIRGKMRGGKVGGRPTDLVKRIVEPLPHARPLTRARFERSMGLVQDIPGLKANSSLTRASDPGGVMLDLDLIPARPTLGFGFSSRTATYVKDGVFTGTGRAYSVLTPGDALTVNATASADFRQLRYGTAAYSAPIGADGLTASVTYAHLDTKPKGTDITGNADAAGVQLSYPLIRSARRNLTLAGGVDFLDSNNASFGSTIAAERTFAAKASALWRMNETHSVLAIQAAITQGFDPGSAHVDPLVGTDHFRYYDVAGEAVRVVGKAVVVRVSGKARWTGDPLPAAQRFTLGGDTFGRAFDDGLLNGDRGYAGSGELAWLPLQKSSKAFGASELYAFIDYGSTTYLERYPYLRTRLTLGSWGGGVRVDWNRRAKLGLELAKPWNLPVAGFDNDWRVLVSWNLSMKQ
ncbi:ShlB/FhaC/HecB family hemolysin secretion/activation protein [Novosphingobium sp. 9]|uniref:ShlB/FhaC/HecB family hemolysin secretion/activation protein n=1 Tax=Novosphingobium sp. 9 TaxID=2025349 RepID=UPI0021B6BD39|nr:ShlB/FhaC/HecB family hemolysin secretion/activation protein [Novosphingobium sp. 9]